MKFDNRPCISDPEVEVRLKVERDEILKMKNNGYPVRAMVAWSSPVTFECHFVPIFGSDAWMDICNRYFDLFPREAELVMNEVADQRQILEHNGFSHDKSLMLIGKVPKGLEKMLDSWHQNGDFWADTTLRNAFFNYFNKFRVANPNASLN